MSSRDCELRINGKEIPITDIKITVEGDTSDKWMPREKIIVDCKADYEPTMRIDFGGEDSDE